MIRIAGNIIPPDNLFNDYSLNRLQRNMIEILATSDKVYSYDTLNGLKFELDLRMSIVEAAKGLYRSGMDFEVFRKTYCNPDYWERMDNGGFLLKDGVRPSEAIRDIFINGSEYGTECATAMVIIYYKAVLDLYPEALFNNMFPTIRLMNWRYLDRNLGINYYRNEEDYLPGDCRYFDNPDVDPETPEWQGENAIDLGNDLYYGHGIGIGHSSRIIRVLNRYRKRGATESAHLLDSATRPNFKYLAKKYDAFMSQQHISASILDLPYHRSYGAVPFN